MNDPQKTEEQLVTEVVEKYRLKLLPTGKHHVSYSELREWSECSYRHKLRHVKKVDLSKPSWILAFGTGTHAACEEFLTSGVVPVRDSTKSFVRSELIKLPPESLKGVDIEATCENAADIIDELPGWLNDTFGEWEPVKAEEFLYENIDSTEHAFKGYVDAVIKTKKGNKEIIWILDFKTTTWGWTNDKKSDPMVRNQLVLYKNFWSLKHNVDLKNIRCGFILLKKNPKQGTPRCELITVSVGDVTSGRAKKLLKNMVASVNRGIAIKNRNSCKYCDYNNTEHCT